MQKVKLVGLLALGLVAFASAAEGRQGGSAAASVVAAKDTSALLVGEGTFIFNGSDGSAERPVPVHYYRPASANADSPILFVMHGTNRDATNYRKAWIKEAEKRGFILIVPEFSKEAYSSALYHYGNIRVDRAPVDSAQWTYVTVEKIFDEVRARTGSNRTTYHIYGHSAGAQFVHRMLWMMPGARIDQAVAANAGWYTLPDGKVNWPNGIGGTAAQTSADDRIRAATSRRVTILLGTADTSTTASDLPKGRAAMAQGPHRFARGHFFYERVKSVAEEKQYPFNWKLVEVPGVAHSNARIVSAAAAAIEW